MNNLVETSYRLRGLLLCAAGVLTLSACAHQPKPAAQPALVQQIDNTQQIEDVVGALRLGDIARARKLLKAMAKRDPADRRVATLMEGLDGDPVKLLGSTAFSYRVEPGDQLTVLAQDFLGNRLKFYVLARYNGLTSDALKPGQILRIPGVAPPPPPPKPRAEARPAPRASAAPPAAPFAPAVSKADPAAAARLRAQALGALNRGAVASAVVTLRRAKSADPNNVLIQRDLARAERLLAAVKARR